MNTVLDSGVASHEFVSGEHVQLCPLCALLQRTYVIFVLSLVILMVHMICQPYNYTKDNNVESMSLATLVFVAGTVKTEVSEASMNVMHTAIVATAIGMLSVVSYDMGIGALHSLLKCFQSDKTPTDEQAPLMDSHYEEEGDDDDDKLIESIT
eukprot:m.1119739 g.1119739  ORF g.1119739 m.1119739 type:complete len:153 (+) comp24392_c1_seq1:367-825(+)